MPRLSTLSNPTALVDIDKNRVTIVTDEGKSLAFSLARLDLSGLKLPSPLNVIAIVRRGNTEERVELGPVSAWDKSFRPLNEIGDDGTWAFRILLVEPGSARLAAAAENVRPDGTGESSSFIGLEAADLGQRPWEIVIVEMDGRVVIRFNREIYQSAGQADADRFFICMILPEAIRRLSEWIAANGAIEDPAWEPFRIWLAMHGVTEYPDPQDEHQRETWCDEVVGAFCDRFEFASQLRQLRSTKGAEE